MSITDYVIDILLLLFIFRQVRPHELTLRTLVLPLTLIVVAGFYLRPVTLTGDDLALVVLLALTGAALGLFSGLADTPTTRAPGRWPGSRPAITSPVPGSGPPRWWSWPSGRCWPGWPSCRSAGYAAGAWLR